MSSEPEKTLEGIPESTLELGSNDKGLYQFLEESSRQIRLLEILPDSQGRTSCRLNTVSLTQNPSYVALSYVWGTPSVTENIL